ncbi:trypsin-like serine peptidase [Streptomyces melanogenes]|uniref:trypsin-like serine peptidase n=1 Tax=Streptomyces melanogenes TaxID=67326 RepID=UPI00167E120C|nr:hypothetical protein [Streptomyces melanogenes]GGP85748.1 hypothetical protein GCM10010278_75220 [Streptomyces melanogenes]
MRLVRRRPAVAAAVLITVLALTATMCGSGGHQDGRAGAAPATGTTRPADLEQWKNGGWKDWDPRLWLRSAKDFFNPVIAGLWGPDRMRAASGSQKAVDAKMAGQGVSDPEPAPVAAQAATLPYRQNAAPVGKIFFDTPEGTAVCSGTVVQDPAHPGKSNLVWSAGHCVHAGRNGGWFRNIAFVPDFNDTATPSTSSEASDFSGAPQGASGVAPLGTWWADWAQTSQQWIDTGEAVGGAGAPFDFSVLHVQPAPGITTSLEEAVGSAMPVDFDAPQPAGIALLAAMGYPAAEPFDGTRIFGCVDRPGRLSVESDQPTMYRIGCTMTGGSSGGGWFARTAQGQFALVSNTSIGPEPAAWLAGPRLGPEARGVFEAVSGRFAGS